MVGAYPCVRGCGGDPLPVDLSAEMESGKTRLLEVLRLLVAKPWFTGRTTTAALTRKIDR